MYGEYDECKGCAVIYMYNIHYVHVYKKYVLLSNGAKWKLNVHNSNVDGSPRRSETAIFILLLIS